MPYKDPDQAREYRRQWQQARRVGETKKAPCITLVQPAVRLRTAADVLSLLSDQVEAVRIEAGVSTCERARTVGYLAGICLRAIEAGDIAARLEALEDTLKARRVA